ncbi:hypothetical protein Tco_1319450 [Tanacetum coccineum]
MKTKAARYEIKGIEDMVPTLWSTIKHAYGHLEEIVVKRSDQQLYTFKEGNFVDLHLNDIEDMLLLAVQHEVFHLDENIVVDFIMALPDELYKFSDGTLKSVHDEIHHRVLDFRLDYNTEMPKRKWMVVDRKRSGLMIELIDKQLRQREIIKNLERLVGARELEMDYTLMTRGEILNGFKAENNTKRQTMLVITWSSKVVRIRYSFPRSSQNQRDLPRDIPLVSVEVHSRHGPSDAMHNPSQPLKASQKNLVSFLTEIKHISIGFFTPSKENGVNILKLIDEGPFQMGTFQETLAKGNKGALHLGPERARVYSDLSPDDKDLVS